MRLGGDDWEGATMADNGGFGSSVPAPRQLPRDTSVFVNRLSDLRELDGLYQGSQPDGSGREMTACLLTGTAGVGKTSLAVHWAYRVAEHFPDGQLYINLRGYDPGEPVTAARALERFLPALGVPEPAVPRDLEARAALFRSVLAGRRVLVVLDNAADAGQVRPLLPAAHGCLALITSRNRMSGLVARDGVHRVTLDVFPEPEAARLLQEITAAYRAGDADEEITELARLCARLPLALRIAAERAVSRPQMPLRDLIRDLRDESELWDALSADDDEADAVRSVFAWSYRALSADAARLFRLLGLHPGPEFGLRAAAALHGDTLPRTRRLLDSLSGAHLVEQAGYERFRFHDLLRAYALDQVQGEETPESRREAADRLFAWYGTTAQRASAALGQALRELPWLDEQDHVPPVALPVPEFPDRAAAQQWLETEWDNLHAVAHAAAVSGNDRVVWQLPLALRGYYELHNAFDGRLDLARNAVAAARRAGDAWGEAENLFALAICELQLDDPEAALASHRNALELYRRMGDRIGEATTLGAMGFAYFRTRELEAAAEHHRAAQAIFEAAGDHGWAASSARNAIEADLAQGKAPSDEMRCVLERGLELHLAAGQIANQVDTRIVLARLHKATGDIDTAISFAREAVETAVTAATPMLEAYALLDLGELQLEANPARAADALTAFQRAAAVHREIGARAREAQAFDGMGRALSALGRAQEAVGFHRRAAAVFAELSYTWLRARALAHLATALEQTGQASETAAIRTEALALIDGLTDPPARSLRSELEA
jgi:tetratricopeptide (TPR) repeat protein